MAAASSSLMRATTNDDADFSTPFLIELRKVFDMFDEDSDGGLSCDELEKVFRQLGVEGDNEDEFRQRVANIILANDSDGDGKLQWTEFVDLMRRNVNVDYRSMFDQFFDHRDGNGQIDSNELKTILLRLGSEVTDSEISTMMKTADCDGDGQINFEEFLALLKARDAPYLLTSDSGIVKVLSSASNEVTTTTSTTSTSLVVETSQNHITYSSASSTTVQIHQSATQTTNGDATVVRSSSLKALLAQIPRLPQDLGLQHQPAPQKQDASLLRLRTLIHSPEFPTAVKSVLKDSKGRGRPRKIPPGWLHNEGGPVENTEEVWAKMTREKQTEAQAESKQKLIEKKEALKREKEELKRKSKKVSPPSDSGDVKRRKLMADAEAVAAAQVARWEEEDALVDKMLGYQDNDDDDDDEELQENEEDDRDEEDDEVSDEDVLRRVPSLAEESAECELLSKVLAGFNEEDHKLLESMVTKARDIDEGEDFLGLSNFTVQSHWDDVEAHRAAAQRWFTLVLRAQVVSAVWNSGAHLPVNRAPTKAAQSTSI